MGTKGTPGQLGAEEICAIIKACSQARVAKIQFGELSLEFAQAEIAPILSGVPALTAQDLAIQIQRSELQDELREQEDIEGELILTDPVRYEELALKGKLSDGISRDQDPHT